MGFSLTKLYSKKFMYLCPQLPNLLIGQIQEAKYIEGGPSTTSACTGWSRFDIPVDRYGGVHSLLQCTGVSYMPLVVPSLSL